MNAAKAYRKLKQVEETKLANRLMLLRLELAKSAKKLDDTLTRTHAISQHATELQQKNQEKIQTIIKKQEDTQIAQTINHISRTRMSVIRRSRVKSIQEHKLHSAQDVITARREHYQRILSSRQENEKRAKAVHAFVKQSVEHGNVKRKQMLLQKREEARRLFQQRVQLEAERSKEAEQHVKLMEAEELKLIKMLEHAQEQQRAAYAQLEDALHSSRQVITSGAEEVKLVMSRRMKRAEVSSFEYEEKHASPNKPMKRLMPGKRERQAKAAEETKDNNTESKTQLQPSRPQSARPSQSRPQSARIKRISGELKQSEETGQSATPATADAAADISEQPAASDSQPPISSSRDADEVESARVLSADEAAAITAESNAEAMRLVQQANQQRLQQEQAAAATQPTQTPQEDNTQHNEAQARNSNEKSEDQTQEEI